MRLYLCYRALSGAPAFLAASLLASHVVASGFPTGSVYDESIIQPNTVDVVAPGSAMTNTQFSSFVASAFSQDFGGVLDGSAVATAYAYGVHQSKALIAMQQAGMTFAGGAPTDPTPISGSGSFATGGRSYAHTLQLRDAPTNEQVVVIALTALSCSQNNYGTVALAGQLHGGGTVNVSAVINAANGAGDTFFCAAAPSGRFFSGFTLSYDGSPSRDGRLWFDDFAFTTAIVPEPSCVFLMLGMLAIGRRRTLGCRG